MGFDRELHLGRHTKETRRGKQKGRYVYDRIYRPKKTIQATQTIMTQPWNEHPVTIVALSKYPDIFAGFDANVKQFAPDFDRILVQDGKLIENAEGWRIVQGPYQFSMAGNANLGWKATDPRHDILYIGDDVRFLEPQSIERMRDLAYADSTIGMLSARIVGGADNPLQTDPPQDKTLVYSTRYLALICTYIKKDIIGLIGYLDNNTFKGYGWEDVDYSRRVRAAGYRLAVAPQVPVQHGLSRKGTETFLRNDKGYTTAIDEQSAANEEAYFQKWGDKRK